MSADFIPNPGVSYDEAWFSDVRINKSAVERRVKSLAGRRAVKKDAQVAFMLKSIECIDLTTLSGDDTPGKVTRM